MPQTLVSDGQARRLVIWIGVLGPEQDFKPWGLHFQFHLHINLRVHQNCMVAVRDGGGSGLGGWGGLQVELLARDSWTPLPCPPGNPARPEPHELPAIAAGAARFRLPCPTPCKQEQQGSLKIGGTTRRMPGNSAEKDPAQDHAGTLHLCAALATMPPPSTIFRELVQAATGSGPPVPITTTM